MDDILERLAAQLCKPPHEDCPWPYADLRDAFDTIERLQRELADTVDMLQQCADRNDEIETLNARLERELSEAKRALLVPGVMYCAKCNFRLHRSNLYMPSGAIGPGGSQTEPCPNGCGPLWPVTWKREASENLTLAEVAHADRVTAERERDEARETLAHTDIGSLPDDWTLQMVAEARIDDLLKLRDQVRDTCTRAEKAERERDEAQRELASSQWNESQAWKAAADMEAQRNESRSEIDELKSQLDAHEEWNARCPDCGRTHFTLLEDKRCAPCALSARITVLQRERDEALSELSATSLRLDAARQTEQELTALRVARELERDRAMKSRNEARRERDEARAAIRNAPHGPSCASLPVYDEYENALFPNSPVTPGDEAKCNCWKHAALGGEG